MPNICKWHKNDTWRGECKTTQHTERMRESQRHGAICYEAYSRTLQLREPDYGQATNVPISPHPPPGRHRGHPSNAHLPRSIYRSLLSRVPGLSGIILLIRMPWSGTSYSEKCSLYISRFIAIFFQIGEGHSRCSRKWICNRFNASHRCTSSAVRQVKSKSIRSWVSKAVTVVNPSSRTLKLSTLPREAVQDCCSSLAGQTRRKMKNNR